MFSFGFIERRFQYQNADVITMIVVSTPNAVSMRMPVLAFEEDPGFGPLVVDRDEAPPVRVLLIFDFKVDAAAYIAVVREFEWTRPSMERVILITNSLS